ncbi:MAG: 50S ribosomal protein L15 [Flavobacteriales bacterium]|nr:50S ribosomal protein L15 [Flavobacteriales bacterium]
MDLSNLKPAAGAVKKKIRLGRGEASGTGGTAGRGHKGAKSRSGYKRKVGFEGGQMPLQRRVPKFGFKNPFRVEYTGVNLDALQDLAETHGVATVDLEVLKAHGLVGKNDLVKILGRGEIKVKLEVTAHAFSKTAAAAIEAAGGTAVTL